MVRTRAHPRDVYLAHSLLESFGMTILEAMTLGVPVVASDIPAHREVCGEAAIYYNPASPTELTQAIFDLIHRESLVQELVCRGYERLKLFDWQRNGHEMFVALHRASSRLDGATDEGPSSSQAPA
jgi:glycosyltransferase involved in cell wall biosynthesis